jgi:serine/threonine protein kinase
VALSAEQPSPQGFRRLEHEYSLAGELDPSWAAKPLALTHHEGRTILVLEDLGGELLDQVLEREQGEPLDLTRFLRVAIGLASGLGQVHRQGLIHKNIKPANVLADEVSNVWLIGFGIASRLPREHQPPVPLEIIAGKLAYMAPKQTGRTARWMPAAISTLWASPCTRCLPVTCRFWRRPPGVGPLSHCARAGAA